MDNTTKRGHFPSWENVLFLYIYFLGKCDRSIGNGGNYGQGFHPDALFPKQLSTLLEAFFNDDAAPRQLGT